MTINETIFSESGEPLGQIRMDLFSGVCRFTPRDDHPLLAKREWRHERDCRRDVLRYFGRLEG